MRTIPAGMRFAPDFSSPERRRYVAQVRMMAAAPLLKESERVLWHSAESFDRNDDAHWQAAACFLEAKRR